MNRYRDLGEFIPLRWGSLGDVLKDIYPEHPWKLERFWCMENGRNISERLARHLGFKTMNDRYSFSVTPSHTKWRGDCCYKYYTRDPFLGCLWKSIPNTNGSFGGFEVLLRSFGLVSVRFTRIL